MRREDAARGDHHKSLGDIWSGANSSLLQFFIYIFLVQLIGVWSEQ